MQSQCQLDTNSIFMPKIHTELTSKRLFKAQYREVEVCFEVQQSIAKYSKVQGNGGNGDNGGNGGNRGNDGNGGNAMVGMVVIVVMVLFRNWHEMS